LTYDPEYVGKQMMAVVTFFNQWLRLKLNIQKCDWPQHQQNPNGLCPRTPRI
jgi:hypothetical protein